MDGFTCYNENNAPAAARPLLEQAKADMGGEIPNMYCYMAESPHLLEAYQYLRSLFMKTSLAPVEQETVLLTINFEHNCHYCMAAHSMRATKLNMQPAVLEALRTGQPIPDERLQTLHNFTHKMVLGRGVVDESEVDVFLQAGFTRQNVLEIVLAISTKILTNYSNHFTGAPLNAFLEPYAWSKPEAVGAN